MQFLKKERQEFTSSNFYKFLGLEEYPKSLDSVRIAHASRVALLRRYVEKDPDIKYQIKLAFSAYLFARIHEYELWDLKTENRIAMAKEDAKSMELIKDSSGPKVAQRWEWEQNMRFLKKFGWTSIAAGMVSLAAIPELSRNGIDPNPFKFGICLVAVPLICLGAYAFKEASEIKDMLRYSRSCSEYDQPESGH